MSDETHYAGFVKTSILKLPVVVVTDPLEGWCIFDGVHNISLHHRRWALTTKNKCLQNRPEGMILHPPLDTR